MDHKKKDIDVKLGVVTHDCIPSTLEDKVRGSGVHIHVITCLVQDYFRLH